MHEEEEADGAGERGRAVAMSHPCLLYQEAASGGASTALRPRTLYPARFKPGRSFYGMPTYASWREPRPVPGVRTSSLSFVWSLKI